MSDPKSDDGTLSPSKKGLKMKIEMKMTVTPGAGTVIKTVSPTSGTKKNTEEVQSPTSGTGTIKTESDKPDSEQSNPERADKMNGLVPIQKRRRPFENDSGEWSLSTYVTQAFNEVDQNLLSMEKDERAESMTVEICQQLTKRFHGLWTDNGTDSEFAFEGLLVLLERSLSQKRPNYSLFSAVLNTLGDSAASFLQRATLSLIECDARNGTDYVEILLLYLHVHLAKSGTDLFAQFRAGLPHFASAYLKTNQKKFVELFAFGKALERRVVDVHGSTLVVLFPRCLRWSHFTSRRVVVANAPPVKLARKPVKSKVTYECTAAAGGLVSGVMPCMRAEDLWVGFMDATIAGMNRVPLADLAKNIKRSDSVSAKLQRCPSVMKATLSDGGKDADMNTQPLWLQTEVDIQRMQRMLDNFAQRNFVVNPLIVMKQEHKPFYDGISNGLLWPAFHNLMSFIVDEYSNQDEKYRKTLDEDWINYIKVNHYFAIHSSRKSRPQDFLWIHDYHLFLVGTIMRSMFPDIRCGFFLHIPYLLPLEFFEKYREQAMAILRGLLAFSRVGFQTQRDVKNFLSHVKKFLPSAVITEERDLGDNRKSFMVCYDNFKVDVGAFAISINVDQLLSWCREQQSIDEAADLKRRLMEGKPPEARLFVCVERFDYTKGIEERLRAFQLYLRESASKGEKRQDVIYQIAAASRTNVATYAEYQDRVTKLAQDINTEFGHLVHMDTENHPHKEVARYYMAADVIMVTPAADGMNLVIKEASICNPKALIVLSTGAGAENQLNVAGLSDCYLRVPDISDTKAFAEVFRQAVTMDPATIEKMTQRLFDFNKTHDIQKWLDSYLDMSWIHDVVVVNELTSIHQFQEMMLKARDSRKRLASRILNRKPFSDTVKLSLENVQRALQAKVDEHKDGDGVTISLNGVELDVRDELDLLKKDLRFIEFYKTDHDIDRFIDFLAESHPRSKTEFIDEMNAVLKMLNFELSDGIDIFITDWDGTMKTYACNYLTSIQPAYSAIILSQFANRYTKMAMVLTAGPLSNFGILDCTTVPWEEGYVTFGGSWGREWMLNGKRVADEKILTNEGAASLDQLAESLKRLLATDEYSKFKVVGSGFQRKVDRITLGTQNVTGKVNSDLSKRYVDAVLKELEKIDPERRIFEVVQLELDLELVLKTQDSQNHWTKADGIRFMLKQVGVDLNCGNVLICGDTVSDLPMIETASQLNPERTYAVFMNPNKEVKSKLATLLDEQHHVVVGCVEVMHAAMAKQVLRPLFVMNEV